MCWFTLVNTPRWCPARDTCIRSGMPIPSMPKQSIDRPRNIDEAQGIGLCGWRDCRCAEWYGNGREVALEVVLVHLESPRRQAARRPSCEEIAAEPTTPLMWCSSTCRAEGSRACPAASGNLTRGVRTCSTHSCWRKSRTGASTRCRPAGLRCRGQPSSAQTAACSEGPASQVEALLEQALNRLEPTVKVDLSNECDARRRSKVAPRVAISPR